MARLMEKYRTELAPKLQGELQLQNVMQVPKVDKVVVNMGLGEAIQNIKVLESAVEELGQITGQKAVITKAKRSIAQFKLREGMPIGCMVTLRRKQAYEFLDRLINVALPRVRDFKGISPKGFDGRGNYTMGIQEQIIFPEIDLEQIDKVKGLNVTIVTTAENDEGGRALLSSLGMPFRK
jgi:large subunit ribosomal protein L5